MLIYRISYLTANGTCVIGLQFYATMPLLLYDFVFNSYITLLFLRPILTVGRNSSVEWSHNRLYRLARRSMLAALVCLIISTANVLILILVENEELGSICLTFCNSDVTLNVISVHWVTIPLQTPANSAKMTVTNFSEGLDSEKGDEPIVNEGGVSIGADNESIQMDKLPCRCNCVTNSQNSSTSDTLEILDAS